MECRLVPSFLPLHRLLTGPTWVSYRHRPCKTGAMDLLLHPIEVRVLGSLLEKEITTPEYYPLSLNALINACNQKSNREPTVNFDQETVEHALQTLRDKGLLLTITGAGSRVPKNGHRIPEKLNLGLRELDIVCELLLCCQHTPAAI